MHFVFYKTNDVFAAEEKLQGEGVPAEVVPTPVQDKAYCGVCIQVESADLEKAKLILAKMDYQLV